MNEPAVTEGVELRSDVIERVEARLPRTEFDSTAAYIEFVLEEVLATVETETGEDTAAEAVDEADVMHRLRSLGYLDE